MTTKMMAKMAEAKKMMGTDLFCPVDYEAARCDWEAETPTWATLKKYASEVGLQAEQVALEWHDDGSLLAALCGWTDGRIYYHTMYSFKG